MVEMIFFFSLEQDFVQSDPLIWICLVNYRNTGSNRGCPTLVIANGNHRWSNSLDANRPGRLMT